MTGFLKFIDFFKEFFNYPIPFGVCILFAGLIGFAIKYILEFHTRTFEVAQKQKDLLVSQMMELYSKAEKRIKKLEKDLDNKWNDKEKQEGYYGLLIYSISSRTFYLDNN